MSTLSELHLLTVLAQEMNMRKAAEKLFVTQPALSQRLQHIEKEWGQEYSCVRKKDCRLLQQEN